MSKLAMPRPPAPVPAYDPQLSPLAAQRLPAILADLIGAVEGLREPIARVERLTEELHGYFDFEVERTALKLAGGAEPDPDRMELCRRIGATQGALRPREARAFFDQVDALVTDLDENYVKPLAALAGRRAA